MPRVKTLRRHSLSGSCRCLNHLESECLLKFCTLDASLASSHPSTVANPYRGLPGVLAPKVCWKLPGRPAGQNLGVRIKRRPGKKNDHTPVLLSDTHLPKLPLRLHSRLPPGSHDCPWDVLLACRPRTHPSGRGGSRSCHPDVPRRMKRDRSPF